MHPFQLLFQLPRKRFAAGAAVTALIALAPVGRAAVFYVDYTGGADTNTGTSASAAWKHCPGDPAAGGAAAATALSAGDTVQFKGGVTYVLTAPIALAWNGVSGAPITYDGNSAGTWGAGRAKISDQNSANGLTAFTAGAATSNVCFTSLEFTAIGGAAALPTDTGTATPARYGAGLKLPTGASNIRVENCVFRDLGYTFNKKPMNAASISGAGISLGNVSSVTIINCQFSNVAYPIDLQSATSLSSVEIGNCTFGDAFVWSLNVPTGLSTTGLNVYGCTEASNQQFARSNWTGYGESPRTTVRTVTAGTTVTFAASAIASPSTAYQWQKNGAAIAAATSSTLTLNAVTSANAGTYTVIATNSVGSNSSNEAVLIVNDPVVINVAPTITAHPTNQTATANSSVSFTAAASGTPTPTFQWLKNGVAIAGATSTTLSLTAVTTSDIATYSMVATNSMGSATSNGATLSVTVADATVAPVITTQPTNQTAAALSSATFTVTASGVPAPTYQWLKNGVALTGATNATLTLSALTSNDIATYAVIASNSSGSVTSNGATLTLTGAPVITSQPVSQTVAALSNVSFNVVASGAPAPSYQWLKNGVALAGATSATLSISSVSATDGATYTVNVSNLAGSVTSDRAVLTVTTSASTNIAPSITLQPTSQTVTALSSVTFIGSASGSPAPTYQWLKNGAPLTGATSSSLTIATVTTSDAGSYSFVATNTAGTVTSSAATLTVNVAPTITLQPVSQTTLALSTVTLTAGASGIPAPGFQWLKNGAAIVGATSTTLTLSNVGTADAASYTFVARNVAGSATSNAAVLTVTASDPTDVAPAITTQPVSQTVNNKSNVTFTAAATGSPAPSFQWKKDGELILGATDASLVLRNVSKGNAGTYSVVASNRAGSAASVDAKLVVNTGNRRTAGVDEIATVASDTRLVNLSVRSSAGSGDESLIVGFVVQGDSPKSLLVRGVGPTLSTFGVPDSLANPSLAVYSGSSLLAANEDWAYSANATQIAAAADATGAFKLAADSADAAILSSVVPGAYTAQVGAEPGSRRTALVEVYDAAPDTSARLVNVSVRTVVSRSETPVIGFVVRGSEPKSLLIRAVGPTLRAFGVGNALDDPQLEIYKDSTRIDQNDNWGGTGTLTAAFQEAGAFALDAADGRDAALIIRAAPGAYTAVVSGAGETDGVVVVEVYELPEPATVQ